MSIKYTYKGNQTEVDSTHIKLTTSGKYLEDDIDIEAEGGGSDGFNILSLHTLWHANDDSTYVFIDGIRYSFTEPTYYAQSHHRIVMPVLSNIHKLKFTASHWRESESSSDSYAYYIKEGETTKRFFSKNVEVTLDSNIHLYIGTAACLLKGTLITMFDGSTKPIEEIQNGDLILGYDKKQKIVNKTQYGQKNLREDYDEWYLSNGITLKTTLRHEFYNVDKQKMMYINEFDIGDHLLSVDDEEIELIGHKLIEEPCMHFSLWCEDNLYYADGMLCGNRHSKQIITKKEEIAK